MIAWFSVETAGDRAESTIVTTFTTTSNAPMNRAHERCRRKQGRGIVADTALTLCRDMISMLGRRYTRVVTGCTIVVVNAKVIKADTRKGRKVVSDVARRAVRARRYVT